MGVVSGIVLSYQFGTNWSRFSEITGNVIGPLIGYEVLTAFFLEATFLGIMLFGGDRVPKWLHAMSAVIVAFGTALSAFWILSANSWMQTPAGYEMRDGIAYPVELVRRSSSTRASPIASRTCSRRPTSRPRSWCSRSARATSLAGRFVEEGRTMVRMGVGMLAVLAPLQLVIGDLHGLNTREAPARQGGGDGSALGRQQARPTSCCSRGPTRRPSATASRSSIPKGASLIITHDPNGLFPGLKDFAARGPAAGVAGVLLVPHHGRRSAC